MMMFGLPPEPYGAATMERRPRKADDRPSPSEREMLWPADVERALGPELLERLYGDVPRRTRLRVEEVCRRLRCSDEHVRQLIETGSLDAVDISLQTASVPCWRVYRYSVVRWLFRREFGPECQAPRTDMTRDDLERCQATARKL